MKVKDLKAAPYNPRKITAQKLKMLAKSMAEFGDLSGIVHNKTTGNLIGGHQRLKCLQPDWPIEMTGKDRGYVVTPWGKWDYRVVEWDEKKEIAANIAANKHGGEFDIPILKDLLVELDSGDFDMELTGFEADELENIFGIMGPGGLTGDDEVPEVQKGESRAKRGDVWLLGAHRLMCGDSTSITDVERLMYGKKADMVFTDPPYGVSIGDKNKALNTVQKAGRCLDNIENDTLAPDDLYIILKDAFTNAKIVLADHGAVYVTAPQGGGLGMMMMMMMQDSGLPIRHILNWVKNSPTFSIGRLDYDYQHEPILFTWNKTHKKIMHGPHKTSCWFIDKPRESKLHPTMKPVEVPQNAVLNSSESGDICLDLFCGSGSTLIACEKAGRIFYGMEIDPWYCEVSIRRWEDYTGKQAELLK